MAVGRTVHLLPDSFRYFVESSSCIEEAERGLLELEQPEGVMKAVNFLLSGCTGTERYAWDASNVEKTLASVGISCNKPSKLGGGNESPSVTLFSSLKSTVQRVLPSFFFTGWRGDA